MTDPAGNCTSAVGDTGRSFDFSAACDSHDYAYDLLRFFGVGGEPRRTADAMFGTGLYPRRRSQLDLALFMASERNLRFDPGLVASDALTVTRCHLGRCECAERRDRRAVRHESDGRHGGRSH